MDYFVRKRVYTKRLIASNRMEKVDWRYSKDVFNSWLLESGSNISSSHSVKSKFVNFSFRPIPNDRRRLKEVNALFLVSKPLTVYKTGYLARSERLQGWVLYENRALN